MDQKISTESYQVNNAMCQIAKLFSS